MRAAFCPQVVSAPDTAAHGALARVRAEYVVMVTGTVRARSATNAKIATGNVEVLAESVTVLNVVTKSLPFTVSGTDVASEEVRLRCARALARGACGSPVRCVLVHARRI